MLKSIEGRINDGVEYLNKNHPGWADKINLDEYDFNSDLKCVHGQLNLSLSWHRQIELGMDWGNNERSYMFHDIWLEKIKENLTPQKHLVEDGIDYQIKSEAFKRLELFCKNCVSEKTIAKVIRDAWLQERISIVEADSLSNRFGILSTLEYWD